MIDIENKIWGFLNLVRGKREIRDLKELLAALIFLKFANDKLSENSFNSIKIAPKAKWDNLKNDVDNNDFINQLWKAFNIIERENVQLSNVFSSFNFENNFNRKNDSELIAQLFMMISDLDFKNDDFKYSNILSRILNSFAIFDGRKGSEYHTPNSVSRLMVELLNPTQGVLLDSACGVGGFFQKTSDNSPNGTFKFYGQEFNTTTLALAKLRFAFDNSDSICFGEPSDTLTLDQFPNLKADFVITHPPFNVRNYILKEEDNDPRFTFGLPPKSNANFAWIQHLIYHLNSCGKGAILLNNNSLSSIGTEGQIRKKIIDADLVEAIITLPSQLLTNSSIPTSIWLFNKIKVNKGKVLFIEASDLGVKTPHGTQNYLDEKSILEITTLFRSWQENKLDFPHTIGFSNTASLKEIAQNDYILTPGRYVGFEELPGVDLSKAISLGEILEYVRPSGLQSNVRYKRVTIKDLSSNPDAYLLNSDDLSEGELRSNFRLLDNNVLLLSRLGTKIKPTFYASSNKQIAYSSNNIYAFKVNQTKILLEYLVAELHKDYIKFQIEGYRTGTSIPMIRRQDLLNILIIIPSLKEQKEIVEQERQGRFQSLAKDLGFEKEIAKLKEAQMRDLGSKKHNIMQHLNNVKSSADVLTKMMELNNGVLKNDEVIDPRRGITVEKRFLRLQESLEKVIYYVDNITNEVKYDDPEILNPIKFLKECKERGLQNDLFTVEFIVEKETFQGREPLISISKNDLEEIYNNILENAINHGFIDKSKSYVFRISVAYIEGFLEINFENNGKAFPLGIAKKYDVKGEKAGETAGTGIGLWKVAEIAKHFDCKLVVFDEPKSEFPVGFKFLFNLEII